ncbi:MAG: hypothetical protein BWY74_00895 [Firmicutes bacterium ADurb.Bin419]|nr:MAG: hypothetical protein BWY74_00895 [Firmicutes bacterium ADurb.Bin419]
MSNKLFLLTKILLKNGFSLESSGKKKARQIAFFVVIAVCFLPVISGMVFFISMLYDALEKIEMQGIILSMGIAVTSFTIFFFGVFYVINVFYYSNDIENLIPFPVRPSEIIGAKFLVTVFYEYLTEILLILPLFIVYAIKSSASIMYYLYALIVFILVPFIPLVIASILVMIIMRFTGIARNRDRFKMFGGIIAMVGAIGFNYLIQSFTNKAADPEQLQKMFLEGQNSMIELVARIFPSAKFAALSIVNNSNIHGITNLIIYVLINLAGFALFLFIGEHLYFKGVIGISEMAAKRKKVSSIELEKVSTRQSKLKSYTIKELKLLFRTPIYFMNCVLMNFIWPIFFILPFITQSQDLSELEGIKVLIGNGNYDGIIIIVAFAASMFISSVNCVTATAISREGQNLYISKYLPTAYKVQIMAKVLSGVVIALIGLTTMLIAAGVILELPLYIMALILLTGLVGILFTSFTGIIIDLLNPKLHWDNEQKAVKQNLNVLFNMLIGIVFAGLTTYGAFVFEFDLLGACCIILFGFGCIDALLYWIVTTNGEKMFNRLEA